MSEWKEYKFSDVIELIGGGTPKTSILEYWNGDIPWLSVVDFNTGKKYVSDTEKKISKEGLNNSSTKLLNKGEIIKHPEGRRLEFKEALPVSADLANTVIAFANDAGGELYIGIQNNPERLLGFRNFPMMRFVVHYFLLETVKIFKKRIISLLQRNRFKINFIVL